MLPARLLGARQAPPELGPDSSGHRIDRKAVGLRPVHPDRRARVFADVLRRERPHLGRASADVAAGRPDRLPDFVNALVFVLAFFLDFFELAFIIIPLLGPAAEKLGIDLIWFGVILAVNMQTSFMHPPFGFALFYLRSVAPKESVHRSHYRQAHRAGHDRPDLLGRRAVRCDPGHHGGSGDHVPADGDALQGRRLRRVDPNTIKIEIPQLDTAAAATSAHLK